VKNLFTSQYRHVIITVLFILTLTVAPTFTQDAEITEEPTSSDVTATAIPTATATPTDTPSPTITTQPSATFTHTLTSTLQPISNTTPTMIPAIVSSTHTSTPTLTPIIEITEDLFPISTTATEVSPYTPTPTLQAISTTEGTPTLPVPISGTLTPIISPTSISSSLVSISPTLTSVSTTLTPTLMPSISATAISTPISPSQTMTTITPTIQPTATIGGFALRYIQGIVRYQNRVTDDAGILLQVYSDDLDLTLISEVITSEDGIYNIAVPMEDAFWVVFSADGHRTERIYHNETEGLADVILVAGDLNGDECINLDDIILIKSELDTSGTLYDLNDDTQTDIADVAMLAGNLNPECQRDVEATNTPESIFTPTATSIYTPTPMTAISSTESVSAEITELPTVGAETTEESETTEEP
jgi:hypothetical protein